MEILREIKDAEGRAKAIIKEAQKNSESSIIKAREEAVLYEQSEVDDHRSEMERLLRKEEEKVQKEGVAIIEDGKKRASKAQRKAEANSEKAVSFLVNKFKEMAK